MAGRGAPAAAGGGSGNPPIVYALVAYGKTVFAEYTRTSGNFISVSRALMAKIQPYNTKMSVVCDQHVFHYVVDDGVTYLCMAEASDKRRIPFAFLEELKTRFTSTYTRDFIQAHKAIAYKMNPEFSAVIRDLMDYYNENPGADKFSKVRGQLDEVRDIMVQNIDKVLERGEKIEVLVDKTETLSQNALKFRKQAKQVRSVMWWKNFKLRILIAVVLILVIYFILAVVCSGPALQGCFGGGK